MCSNCTHVDWPFSPLKKYVVYGPVFCCNSLPCLQFCKQRWLTLGAHTHTNPVLAHFKGHYITYICFCHATMCDCKYNNYYCNLHCNLMMLSPHATYDPIPPHNICINLPCFQRDEMTLSICGFATFQQGFNITQDWIRYRTLFLRLRKCFLSVPSFHF